MEETRKPGEGSPEVPPEGLSEVQRALLGGEMTQPAPSPEARPAQRAMEEAAAVFCYKHPDNPATFQCPECEVFYCDEDATLWHGKLVCTDCAKKLEAEWVARKGLVPGVDYQPEEEKHLFAETPPDFDPSGSLAAGMVASPVRRAVQGVLDLAFIRLLLLIYFYMIYQPPAEGFTYGGFLLDFWQRILPGGSYFLLAWVIDFVYLFLFLAFQNRTLGMWLLNMRVCTLFGDFLSPGQVFIRTLVQVPTFGLGLVISPFLSTRQALHDLAAGSVVINYSGLRAIDPNDQVVVKTVGD